ncbi:MAG: AHH domain-containing protein, partial [Pseudomonadota bacterium]
LNYDYFRQGWVWGSYLTETCLQFDGPTVISAMHSPLASQWCSTLSHGNAVFGTGGLSATGINLNNLLLSKFSPNQIIASVNTARGTLQLARAYTTAAAFVLVADNVTIVGVADDIALIPILGAFGVTVALEHVLDDIQDRLVLMAQTDNPDIAERDKDGTETVSFAISDNCDPGQNGASQNLRRNMKKAGCLCEDVPFKNGTDVQAHHIVPKGITTDTAKALRSCLERKQIRIHDAVNGVCLPNDLELASKTRAYRHITGGDLHSENVLSVLLKRCESMSPSEFRAYLREVADLYTIGAVPI